MKKFTRSFAVMFVFWAALDTILISAMLLAGMFKPETTAVQLVAAPLIHVSLMALVFAWGNITSGFNPRRWP